MNECRKKNPSCLGRCLMCANLPASLRVYLAAEEMDRAEEQAKAIEEDYDEETAKEFLAEFRQQISSFKVTVAVNWSKNPEEFWDAMLGIDVEEWQEIYSFAQGALKKDYVTIGLDSAAKILRMMNTLDGKKAVIFG